MLAPALITLAITALRLVGELQGWSPRFFNREAGGGAAVVGIVWLVPVFGIYFALKLARMGHGPPSAARAIGIALASLLVLPAAVLLAGALGIEQSGIGLILVFAVASVLAIGIAWTAWPALGTTLVVYGLAARLPVAFLMLVAIFANWGTHYELGPPNLPAMGPFARWLVIGLIPQLTFWMAFTAVVGAIVGSVAVAIEGQDR